MNELELSLLIENMLWGFDKKKFYQCRAELCSDPIAFFKDNETFLKGRVSTDKREKINYFYDTCINYNTDGKSTYELLLSIKNELEKV
jgi:hypothetical protein